MFGSLTVQDNMVQVLARIFRTPVSGKPIAVLALGGLPSELVILVVAVLALVSFDCCCWGSGVGTIPFVF